MQEIIALAGIVGALTAGVVSPGPSFVMVARLAVAESRAAGVAAALGMGLGGVLFAGAALLGLQAAMLAVPAVYFGLKVAGGIYLCVLGARIFLAARRPLAVETPGREAGRSRRRPFWLGFATQISNPKTAVVYAGVFAVLLPATFSPIFAASLLCVVFVVEAGWYAAVAALLSSARPLRSRALC